MEFPIGFVDQSQPVPLGLSREANETIYSLEHNNYEVHHGLSPQVYGSIAIMALQKHIAAACPEDQTASRFDSRESAELWMRNSGGRAVFSLMRTLPVRGQRLVGYGWTGPKPNDEVEGYDTTIEIRIGEEALGKGLSTPFAHLMIEASRSMFDAQKYWLHTWENKPKAITAYEALGFRRRTVTPSFKTVKKRQEFEGRIVMTLDH